MAVPKETHNKIIIKKKLIAEGLMALVISITPIIFYSYEYLPKDPDETWNILGMTFTNYGFPDVSTFFWYILSKTIPLGLLVFWFLTCKHWWYHAVIIPIAMYAFQLITLFTSNETAKLDKEELMWLLPVCMIIIPIVYFIRVKLFDKYVHGIDLEAMEAELSALKEKQGSNQQKREVKEVESTEDIGFETLSEKLDRTLSTQNLETMFKQFHRNLQNWLHFKF